MIVLLYERIVVDLESARRALEEENRVEFAKLVNHSQRIVSELRSALDHSIGGDIANNLESLYTFLFHEHLEILLDRNPEHIDNCLKVVTPLLDAWRQIPTGTGEKAALDQAQNRLSSSPGPNSASPKQTVAESAGSNESGADPTKRTHSLLSVSA